VIVYDSAEAAGAALPRPVVTLGNFDGVHRGHQAILAHTLQVAARTRRPALCATFRPHPLKVIRPESAPPLLTEHDEKMRRIEDLGFRHALVIPFTPAFAQIPAEAFVRDTLHRDLGASAVLVGNNFNFGRGREGNVALLRRLGRDLGIEVPETEDCLFLGSPVSSSRIRRALLSGEVELARELLGRPFAVRGTVVRGASRGAALGFPTANLRAKTEILPADGVYVTLASSGEHEHPSVTNVGSRPTFPDAAFAVETHLLDAAPDLYGAPLEIRFLGRLRPELKFDNPEQLSRQIAADVERARRFFHDVAPAVPR